LEGVAEQIDVPAVLTPRRRQRKGSTDGQVSGLGNLDGPPILIHAQRFGAEHELTPVHTVALLLLA
jgi:hypothetical protein